MTTITVPMADYLRQWVVYHNDGKTPVAFPRGSAENAVLHGFLRRRRASDPPVSAVIPDGCLQIVIPEFKGMPSIYFNVLGERAADALVAVISSRFDTQLFLDLNPLIGITQIDDAIWAWMQKNGIEDNERNFHAVKKRFQRRRKVYLNAERRKAKKFTENLGNNPR